MVVTGLDYNLDMVG